LILHHRSTFVPAFYLPFYCVRSFTTGSTTCVRAVATVPGRSFCSAHTFLILFRFCIPPFVHVPGRSVLRFLPFRWLPRFVVRYLRRFITALPVLFAFYHRAWSGYRSGSFTCLYRFTFVRSVRSPLRSPFSAFWLFYLDVHLPFYTATLPFCVTVRFLVNLPFYTTVLPPACSPYRSFTVLLFYVLLLGYHHHLRSFPDCVLFVLVTVRSPLPPCRFWFTVLSGYHSTVRSDSPLILLLRFVVWVLFVSCRFAVLHRSCHYRYIPCLVRFAVSFPVLPGYAIPTTVLRSTTTFGGFLPRYRSVVLRSTVRSCFYVRSVHRSFWTCRSFWLPFWFVVRSFLVSWLF